MGKIEKNRLMAWQAVFKKHDKNLIVCYYKNRKTWQEGEDGSDYQPCGFVVGFLAGHRDLWGEMFAWMVRNPWNIGSKLVIELTSGSLCFPLPESMATVLTSSRSSVPATPVNVAFGCFAAHLLASLILAARRYLVPMTPSLGCNHDLTSRCVFRRLSRIFFLNDFILSVYQ